MQDVIKSIGIFFKHFWDLKVFVVFFFFVLHGQGSMPQKMNTPLKKKKGDKHKQEECENRQRRRRDAALNKLGGEGK